jgi:hypothetical protein
MASAPFDDDKRSGEKPYMAPIVRIESEDARPLENLTVFAILACDGG